MKVLKVSAHDSLIIIDAKKSDIDIYNSQA